MLIRSRPRARLAVLATAVAATTGLLISGGVASAATVTIPQQGGNHKFTAAPGDTVVAGYDFTYVAGTSTVIKSGSAVLSVSCADGSTPAQTSITVAMPYQEYLNPEPNSNGWVPSGNQADASVYQGSYVLPDLCTSGTNHNMTIGESMGPFVADVYSDAGQSLSFRWHYGPASVVGSGSSWSATKSVTPDALSAVSMVSSLGRMAPLGLLALFALVAGVVFLRQRRHAGASS